MRTPYVLSCMLGALMIAQAVLGLAFPGLYRDTGYVGETWFGNDAVTLALAVPVLISGLLLERRASARGRLLWLGAAGYGLYNYAFYMLGAALNAFFPLYVAAFLLSAAIVILALSRIDARETAARFSPRTPAVLIGGYMVFTAAGLAAVWMAMWAAHVFEDRPIPAGTEAFKLVASLDLTMMVPALAAGGVLLARRRAWGYIIAAIALIQGSLYLIVLTLNGAIFIVRGLSKAPGELPVWGTLAAATSAAASLLVASARGGRREGT